MVIARLHLTAENNIAEIESQVGGMPMCGNDLSVPPFPLTYSSNALPSRIDTWSQATVYMM